MSDLVRQFARLLDESSFTQRELADKAGFAHNAVFSWTKKTKSPGLLNFDAALQVLGYRLAIVPAGSDAPVFLTQEESEARVEAAREEASATIELMRAALEDAAYCLAISEPMSKQNDFDKKIWGDDRARLFAANRQAAYLAHLSVKGLLAEPERRSRSAQRAGEGGGS